ncbi:MAG: hypothetical protein ACLRS2_19760 [[Clostridium] innocuum]
MKTLEEGLAKLTSSIQIKTADMLNTVFTNMKSSISKNITSVQQSISGSLKDMSGGIQNSFGKVWRYTAVGTVKGNHPDIRKHILFKGNGRGCRKQNQRGYTVYWKQQEGIGFRRINKFRHGRCWR